MRNRLGLVIVAVLAALVVTASAPPAAAGVDVHLVVPAPYLVVTAGERQAGDLLLLAALAAFFDADVHVVVPLYPAWSVHDIVLILAIHHHSRRGIGDIIALRKRHGLGWGEVAHRLGVHPGAFNQQRVWAKKQDHGIAEGLLVTAVAGHWGLPSAHVRALRAKGYPAREIALGANVASRSGKELGEVLKTRAAGQGWDKVAERFGVDPGQLDQPVKAKGRFGAKGGAAAQDKPGQAGKAAKGGPGHGKGPK